MRHCDRENCPMMCMNQVHTLDLHTKQGSLLTTARLPHILTTHDANIPRSSQSSRNSARQHTATKATHRNAGQVPRQSAMRACKHTTLAQQASLTRC